MFSAISAREYSHASSSVFVARTKGVLIASARRKRVFWNLRAARASLESHANSGARCSLSSFKAHTSGISLAYKRAR